MNGPGVKALLLKIIGISIILGGTAAAGDAKDASQPAAVPLYSVQATVTQMQQDQQAWVNATLHGDDGTAGRYERALYRAVAADLRDTQDRVRQLAKDVALSSDSSGHSPGNTAVTSGAQRQFSKALKNLKAKHAIYGALGRTDAFSNKYRLMGDYIYLLRQESGMLSPDLAAVQQTESPDKPAAQGESEK